MVTFALLIGIVSMCMILTVTVAVVAITMASPVILIVGLIIIDVLMCVSLIKVIRRMIKRDNN